MLPYEREAHWHKFVAVFSREYMTRVKSRWFMIATFFAPIILAAMIFAPVIFAAKEHRPAEPRELVVIDASGTALGDRLVNALESNTSTIPSIRRSSADTTPTTTLRRVRNSELERAEQMAERDALLQQIAGYVVIDSNTVLHGTARYISGSPGREASTARIEAALAPSLIALKLASAGLPPEQVEDAVDVSPRVTAVPLYRGSHSTDARALFAIFLAFLMYMSIILYSQNVLSSVIEEKTSRVAEVVVSSVKPDILLAGKVLGVSAVGLTQQAIWLVMSVILLAIRNAVVPRAADAMNSGAATGMSDALFHSLSSVPGGAIALYILFFLLGFIFFGSLFAALGATVSTESDARQAVQPIFFLLVLSVVAMQPVLTHPNSGLAQVLSLVPLSSPIIMPLRMGATDISGWQVALSVLILAASAVGALWLSARIYRVGLLMYGKRPTLSQLRRWITESM